MRPSFYNYFVASFFKDCVIAYNSLHGSFLALTNEEFSECESIMDSIVRDEDIQYPHNQILKRLIQAGFIIDDSVNEQSLIRGRYYEGRKDRKGLSLTIAPTIDCNFNCTYCYQEHRKSRMSPDNVRAVTSYVERHLESDSAFHVTWFGGEPLLAFDVIVNLCECFRTLCHERNCQYTQSIITNGSLLDDRKIDFFDSHGDVRFVQITVDGLSEIHDQRRPRIGNGTTFETVLQNVEAGADRLPIVIRINIDRTNYRELPRLVEQLGERGLRRRVPVYLGHVLPFTELCSETGVVALSRKEFAEIEAKFQLYLFQRGWNPTCGLPKPRAGHLCVADDPLGAVLSPGNLIFRCWNEAAMSEEKASGMLQDSPVTELANPLCSGNSEMSYSKALAQCDIGGVSQGRSHPGQEIGCSGVSRTKRMDENRRRWGSLDPFAHEVCQTCKILPLCLGGCLWESRKKSARSAGHCTPLRFNLLDKLRMYHLRSTVASSLQDSMKRNSTSPGECVV